MLLTCLSLTGSDNNFSKSSLRKNNSLIVNFQLCLIPDTAHFNIRSFVTPSNINVNPMFTLTR